MNCIYNKGLHSDIDNGLSLALAYWTRAIILLEMGEGELSMIDLKLAVSNGLQIKDNPDYYLKLTTAYTCNYRFFYYYYYY